MVQPASAAFLAGQPVNPVQAPPLSDVVSGGIFEIDGTENIGDSKIIVVPPNKLPSVPYDWQLNYFYLYNGEGSEGNPSGSWQFEIFTSWDGTPLDWRVATRGIDIAPYFAMGIVQRLLKPHMLAVALQNWMSGDGDGGVRYRLLCTAPPVLGAAKLIAGVNGSIYLNE